MKAEFDITITSRDMYKFSMNHTYTGCQGIITIVLAIVCFVMSGVTYGSVERNYTILYVVFGMLFLFYMPMNLYLRSKRQFLMSEVLKNPLHYVVDEEGIHTSQKEASAELSWEQVYKMMDTKQYVYIYSNRVNAYIIPKEQLKDQYEVLRRIALAQMPGYRCKMK